ncbi:MAG: 50S ribosome-binding GTPase, partial [Planctomycetaceae bacterium]|nr:50S ribosome-binding GTPase [Planctomycetaceae bacterium]
MTGTQGASQEDPKILILSGPSGSGKTTIVKQLMERQPVRLVKSISATTRPPRAHEVDQVDYYFLDRPTFEEKLEKDEFLEHAEVFQTGYLYGTL